jgi:excisionase family DNA binding protein
MSTEVPVVPTAKRWLTREEAADYLGTNARWMRRAVEQGLFPAHKRNRLVLFLREELDDYIEASRIDRSGER